MHPLPRADGGHSSQMAVLLADQATSATPPYFFATPPLGSVSHPGTEGLGEDISTQASAGMTDGATAAGESRSSNAAGTDTYIVLLRCMSLKHRLIASQIIGVNPCEYSASIPEHGACR